MKTASLLAVMIVAMATGNVAEAQRKYYDALAFDLRGNVKECTVTNSSDEKLNDQFSFNADGSIASDNAEAKRNEKGLPTEITREEPIDPDNVFDYLYGPDEITMRYTYTDMRKTQECDLLFTFERAGYDTKYSYYYAANGSCIIATKDAGRYREINGLMKPVEEHSQYYFELEGVDSHKNWTTRKVYDAGGGNYDIKYLYTETRKITYWDDGSPDVSVVDVFFNENMSAQPAQPAKATYELRTTDLMCRPFGVVKVTDNNPWGITYPEVKAKIAEMNPYWEIRESGYGSSSLNKVDGFYRTYHGEPIDRATVEPSADGHLKSFGVAFRRDRKGVVRESWDYQDVPQWTESEAIDFARTLIADMEATGLKMVEGSNPANDILTLIGHDSQSFYQVSLFLHDGEYTVPNYTIYLDVYPLDSSHNQFRYQ